MNSLLSRLLVAGIGIPFAGGLLIFVLYYNHAKELETNRLIERAKASTLMAEAVREHTDSMWESGVYTFDQLKAYIEEGKKEEALSLVPVVSAMQTLASKADEQNFEFRAPKFKPRNMVNTPDTIDAMALNKMSEDDLDEHIAFDPEENSVRYYRSIKLTATCLHCHGDPDTSQERWGNSLGLDGTGGKMEGWKVGQRHGAFSITQNLDEVDAAVSANALTGGLIGMLVLGGVGIFFSLFAKSLSANIGKAEKQLKQISEFDLDSDSNQQVAEKDEVGRMQNMMHKMLSKLQERIIQILNNSTEVSVNSTLSTNLSEQLEKDLDNTSSTSEVTLEQTKQLEENVEQMSEAVSSVNEASQSVAAAMQQVSAAVNEIASNCARQLEYNENAQNRLEENNTSMTQLTSAADNIGNVLQLIQDIASKTNLLALNATIEAASAGEAGKGFAVVASEVKDLSRQTADATDSIQSHILHIQEAVRTSKGINDKLAETVQEMNNMAQNIAVAVEEQSATFSNVTENMHSISVNSDSLSENTKTVTEFAQSVTQQMEQSLKLLTFTVLNAQRITHLVKVNNSQIQRMDETLGMFKLPEQPFDIRAIKAAHLDWLFKLSAIIRGESTLGAEEISSSSECKFGKWLYDEGKKLSDLPEYSTVEIKHKEVHELARKIVATKEAGNQEKAIQMMTAFEETKNQLFTALDKLYYKAY